MNDKEFRQFVAAARIRNQERDAMDRRVGFAAPGEIPEHLPVVAKDALECAIRMRDWSAAAEAWVFLEQFSEAAKERSDA